VFVLGKGFPHRLFREVEVELAGWVFGEGEALEHEPQRDVADEFAVGEERRTALRRGGGKIDAYALAGGKEVHAHQVADEALALGDFAAHEDDRNVRGVEAGDQVRRPVGASLKRDEEDARDRFADCQLGKALYAARKGRGAP